MVEIDQVVIIVKVVKPRGSGGGMIVGNKVAQFKLHRRVHIIKKTIVSIIYTGKKQKLLSSFSNVCALGILVVCSTAQTMGNIQPMA